VAANPRRADPQRQQGLVLLQKLGLQIQHALSGGSAPAAFTTRPACAEP
jgi:hypothetical protein